LKKQWFKSNFLFLTFGAGDGNRTHVFSLEGCCSTIELHPLVNYKDHKTSKRNFNTFLIF
tara:strand:+ start:827 stop:1006 length:180 start_codon:yes stop_codon:yes gene_type:complete